MIALSRPYASREGAPVVDRVDPRIFTLTYFRHCLDCNFCHDSCCQYGVDTEITRYHAIMAHADALERHLAIPRGEWFRLDPDDVGILSEPDYPGGEYTRTAVVELPLVRSGQSAEGCVFLDPAGRGCRLHGFALQNHIDVHAIKPMCCLLFPVSFAEGLLHAAVEFDHDDLACTGPGDSVYRGARSDLEWYFGSELIFELDEIENQINGKRRGPR
jgi:Fe-S-cluster containining protein